jgi:branched-chain amino acid transport system ATP-binding protein
VPDEPGANAATGAGRVLELDGVRTFYGNIEALKGVSFHIDRQEIIAILGSNGAGKTTCLSSIVGLTPPRSGRVVYEGADIRGRSTDSLVKGGLVMVPEGRRIFPALTVLENLRMGAYLRRDRQGIKDDLDYILEMFPILAARAGQDGGTLSGGEQQMLAISRGLMGRPRMLLLDEPSLGLAPIVIRSIFDTIKKINQEQKTTILLVEQNANLALQVAHRAYIMTTGLITLEGTASELMNDESVRKAYLGG